MKTTYAEWKEFLDSWPEGDWFDDADVAIDGIPEDDFKGDPEARRVAQGTTGPT